MLGTTATVCIGLVTAVHHYSQPRILAAAAAFREASLLPLLGALRSSQGLTHDVLELAPPHGLPAPGPATIDRFYTDGQPAALVLEVTIAKGYAGPIRLRLGIAVDGTLTGVQVLGHAETPGLGDQIEPEKSDWLMQLVGRSLTDPPRAAWAIARDGGEFDQITGASITSRAVVHAVRDALQAVQADWATLFAAPVVDDRRQAGSYDSPPVGAEG